MARTCELIQLLPEFFELSQTERMAGCPEHSTAMQGFDSARLRTTIDRCRNR